MYVCIYVHMYVYMYHIFFTHSSINRHLDCFQVLAIVNSSPELNFN